MFAYDPFTGLKVRMGKPVSKSENEFVNSIDQDEAAFNKPLHHNQGSLPTGLRFFNMIEVQIKHFLNCADVKILLSAFLCFKGEMFAKTSYRTNSMYW